MSVKKLLRRAKRRVGDTVEDVTGQLDVAVSPHGLWITGGIECAAVTWEGLGHATPYAWFRQECDGTRQLLYLHDEQQNQVGFDVHPDYLSAMRAAMHYVDSATCKLVYRLHGRMD